MHRLGGATSSVLVDGGVVTKTIIPSWLSKYPCLLSNEVSALEVFGGRISPKMISNNKNSITMHNCGLSLTKLHLIHNRNRLEDFLGTSGDLIASEGFNYVDLKLDNILFDGNRYWLIDFGWCHKINDVVDYYPSHLLNDVGVSLNSQLKKIKIKEEVLMENNLEGMRYAGSNVNKGFLYATIPLQGLDQAKAHRKDSYDRIATIKSFFMQRLPGSTKRRILDIGSAGGAMSLPLVVTEEGKKDSFAEKVFGIDHDKDMVELVKKIASDLGVLNKTSYTASPITYDSLEKIIKGSDINGVICTSVYMWIIKALGLSEAKKVLRLISEHSKCMIFECSIGDGMAGDAMKQNNLTSTEALISHVLENTEYNQYKIFGKTKGWLGRDIIGFWKQKENTRTTK